MSISALNVNQGFKKMTASKWTTFEVKVSNKLTNESIWVQIASKVTSSSYDHSTQNISQKYRKPLDENAATDYKSDNDLKEESIELKKQSINPGFVRITPLQELSIPVIVENEAQIVYITVYSINYKGEQIVIANQLPINRQLIEIKRNELTNDIEISPQSEMKNNTFCDFRNILLNWGIPQYLCDSMEHCGWNDPAFWDDITEQHLIKMGFKDGHRVKFNHGYTAYNKTLSFKELLKEWGIPIYLYGNMRVNGWDDISLWNEINNDDLKEMGFKNGHIKKFKKYIKNNSHIKQFEKMQKGLNENETKYDDEDDEDGEHDDNDNKSEYDMPNTPSFKISDDKIYQDGFDIIFDKMAKTASYVVEIDENNQNEWKSMAEISQKKRHRINGLKSNSVYLIRVCAENACKKKSEYSKVFKIKTKDKKWSKSVSKRIPKFEYNVANNNNFVWISFENEQLNKIKFNDSKYNDRYFIEIGLFCLDDGDSITLDKMSWNKIDDLSVNKLNYEYNINDNNDNKYNYFCIRISSFNDLSYFQYSSINKYRMNRTEQSKFNIHTKYGKHIKIRDDKTIGMKEYNGNGPSILFGEGIGSNICNQYQIHFKINRISTCFCFGYVISKNKFNCNSYLGFAENKNYSVGILIHKDNNIYLNDGYHTHSKLEIINSFDFKLIKPSRQYLVTFNFIDESINFEIKNDKKNEWKSPIKPIKNKNKIIIPAFSMFYKGDEIEIIKWKLM